MENCCVTSVLWPSLFCIIKSSSLESPDTITCDSENLFEQSFDFTRLLHLETFEEAYSPWHLSSLIIEDAFASVDVHVLCRMKAISDDQNGLRERNEIVVSSG